MLATIYLIIVYIIMKCIVLISIITDFIDIK